MFTPLSQRRSPDGASQDCGKDISEPGSMMKKKAVLPPLPCASAAFENRPLPRLFPNRAALDVYPRPLSVVELPRLIAQVGPERAMNDTKWTKGPRLMASALGADIPVGTTELTPKSFSLTGEGKSTRVTASYKKKRDTVKKEKDTKPKKVPLTATEVIHILLKEKDKKMYYLKKVEGDSYRPYDLQVVEYRKDCLEYYVFSSDSVLHIIGGDYSEIISLTEWYRESVFWTALQEIPFFRMYRLQKPFTWWHKIVRRRIFQRRSMVLQDKLIMVMPHFRHAFFMFNRVFEELRGTHLLPLKENTYTLLEFKNMLKTMNQEVLEMLKKLSCFRSFILNKVRDDCYKAHRELQLHLKYSQESNTTNTHQQLTHYVELMKEHTRCKNALKKLGDFAAVINHMTMQSIVTITNEDFTAFLNNILKRQKSEQVSLFDMKLCPSNDSGLTVEPSVHLCQTAVSEAVLSVREAVIQMCDSCGLFLESNSSVHDSAQDVLSDFSTEYLTFTEKKSTEEVSAGTLFCCRQCLKDPPSSWPVSSYEVQGKTMRGCYNPLTRGNLKWQISISDVTKNLAKEHEKLMQEAQVEILQLCESYSWIQDIHLFTTQWSQESLESMMDQPNSVYEELFKKLRLWTERIHTIPSSVTTSNNIFIIQCTSMKENLGEQLRIIEEEVKTHLAEQIELEAESLLSGLDKAASELEADPKDLHDLSQYAQKFRESTKMLDDTQKRLEYILALQHTFCMNYREMTDQEGALERKLLATWEGFLSLLKHAENIICNQLPYMSQALDSMFSFSVCNLKNTVSKATSGPFVDPAQDAKETVSSLIHMCEHVQNLSAKLEEMSRTSQDLRGHPMDMSSVTTDIKQIKARKELWELMYVCKSWMEQWKQLPFSEVVVSQTQEKTAKWREQALSLRSIIPKTDAVLQEILGFLESLSPHLAAMAQLQSTPLKQKHWNAIFIGMDLLYDPERKVMVADLMSEQYEVNQKLINQICRKAQEESDIEQTFLNITTGWEARVFQLDKFFLPVWEPCEPHHDFTREENPTEGTYSNLESPSQQCTDDLRLIIIGLDSLLTEIENDRMTLSVIIKSPHAVEFKQQVEEWMQTLQDLDMLFYLMKKYQQTWAFLTKILHGSSFCLKRDDLLDQFQSADETFKEMLHCLSVDPHVLNLVQPKEQNDKFRGESLLQILTSGLSAMDEICSLVTDQMDTLIAQFPRLWFLNSSEVMQLLSSHPTHDTLQPFICKCFKGVCWLEVDFGEPTDEEDVKGCTTEHRQMKVLGIFGSLREHITFLSPLESNISALAWLSDFEKHLRSAMVQLMNQCSSMQSQLEPYCRVLAGDENISDYPIKTTDRKNHALPELDLLSGYPLQCVLVVEELVWGTAVLKAFPDSNPRKLSCINTHISKKLDNLGRYLRNSFIGVERKTHLSRYMMMCLRALVQLTIKHAQQLSKLMEVQHVPLESSFEWQSLMKYCIMPEDTDLRGNTDVTCFIDVLSLRLQYDYEYFGPEDLEMVHTQSTDQAKLGILLALTSYKCGFLSGPPMAGKKTTVVQLGKALGRQIVSIQCGPCMRPDAVQRMLWGALSTGAWLLFDCVDSLKQRVLSALGQHLEDIHLYFSMSTGNKTQGVKNETKDEAAECKTVVDSAHHMVLAGKSISARLNYGCVFISSKRYLSVVPQSLRCATRPIILTHPDYRIIAEVMLTSIGFSEAMPLSRHLVSLISLAKDSNCLPDFITNDQSCYLVVLQRIISASEVHLQRSARQRDISEQPDLTSSQNVSGNAEKNTVEKTMPSRLADSQLSVIFGLMEETAVVNAIQSVFYPFLYEQKKTSQFSVIFKETFPIVNQFPFIRQYIEEEEKTHLNDAVAKELQSQGLQSNTDIINSALTLYQNIKFSRAVLLLGPPGSGKTVCYSALAGALNLLTFHVRGKNNIEEMNQQSEPTTSVLTWNSVNTVVLFPNTMSNEELFGIIGDRGGRKDGAVAKVVLRDSDQCEKTHMMCKNTRDHTSVMKWLVMDGEPLGQPGWLDNLATLCTPEDALLCLPSCENLRPASEFKLLIETSNLEDASPSAVSHCCLVYFAGTDLWKSVWKSEIKALSREHNLDQNTLKLWKHLAEDLFSRTLISLQDCALASAIISEGERRKCSMNGLQEIMSVVRVIRALLPHYGMEVGTAEAALKTDDKGDNTKKDLLARNLFLVAYIWGFSGHLHPRHLPQFDLQVCQLLFSCRYKIIVPEEESVFDCFFNTESRTMPKTSGLTSVITPKYGKYIFLLNLMLEANQPVMLAGEVGSGKTTLCKTLLNFQRPHISLPVSPLLSSRDLRTLVGNIKYQDIPDHTGDFRKRQHRLLLFMDDLHEAPCDIFGKTSTALETLRQSISTGGILTYDTSHVKSLSSRCLSYMTACCVFGSGNHQRTVMSSRLSRLFSIFVLPSLSLDVIFSIHSPRLKSWLKEMPLKYSCEVMAYCIITATKTLYDVVCEQFQPTAQRPHVIFSHHDIQKVFWGMCLWQPKHDSQNTATKAKNSRPGFPLLMSEPAALSFDIAQLWMHECMRTFSDRLGSEDDHSTLVSLVSKTAAAHYGIFLIDEAQPTSSDDQAMNNGTATDTLPADTESTCKPLRQCVDGVNTLNLPQEQIAAGQSKLQKCHPQTEPSPLSEDIHSEQAKLKTDSLQPQIIQYMKDTVISLVFDPEFCKASKLTNSIHNSSSFYQDLDLSIVQKELLALINREEEKNGQNDIITPRYMLHRQRVNQLLHILRVLLIPGGHGLLISSERGTGRKTNVRLAASLMDYQLMEVHPGNESGLHGILKEAGNQTRKEGTNVIILAHEGISQSVRDGLLVAMAHRTFPGLYTDEELRNLVSRVTEVKNSKRYTLDNWTLEKFLSQIHRNVHVFLLLPSIVPDSNEMHANKRIHGLHAQLTKALSCSFCVELYQPWSKQSLEESAAQCLQAYLHKKEGEGLEARLSAVMAEIHQSACRCASVCLTAQPFSPQTFMEFIAHFIYLYKHMSKQQQSQADRFATALSKLDVISNTMVDSKNNILRLQVEVAETQQLEKELLRAKDYHMNRLKEAHKTHIEEEKKLCYTREGGMPVILSGIKILKCLNPLDLEEVRHYRDPPDGVVQIMDAICLLFDRSPGWENVKQLLGQPNFFQEMEFFDHFSLTKEKLQQLGHLVKSPQFVPESVREVSKACESLCRWVQAVYECCCLQHQLLLTQPSQGETLQRLCRAMQDKTDACHHLEGIEPQLQDAKRRLEEQMAELHTAERLEKETAKTVELMESHVRDWRAAALENELKNRTLHGDALILAAAISYLGPFGPDTRTELLSKWSELCQAGNIEVNPKGLRTSMFSNSDTGPSNPLPGFPITVSESLQPPAGLAVSEQQDAPENGVVVKLLLWGCRRTWVQRWLLLVDPQQNLDVPSQSWFIPGEKNNPGQERECRLVICADDPKLLDKLDQAAAQGLTVMVTHIERAVPSPQFLVRLTRSAGRLSPAPEHHIQQIHPEFCLFLVTNQPVKMLNSEIHPSILALVGVVDLSLSSEEIQELMLIQLLQFDCKDLLIQQLQFQNDKQLLQEKLVSEEEDLMGYILHSNTTLLHDSDFHRRAFACQETMKSLRAEIRQLSDELEYHRSLLTVPRQLMMLAADLYKDLQDVSRLSPAYYFSLCGFVAVLQDACIVKGRPLVPFSIRKGPKDVIPEVTNRMVTQLFLKYRPQLFKSHFAVLKVLVSLTLLRHNQLCSEAERMAFIRGFGDTLTLTNMKPHPSPSTCALPSWIPPHIRPELFILEKMPGFEGLIASLSACPAQWQEYLTSPSSAVVGPVPCRSHSHLSVLQRALLWKTINPDCLEGLTEAMAAYHPLLLGQTGGIEAPHTGNPKALLQAVSSHKGPVTLILPSLSREERTHIQPLHLISTIANCVEKTKKVEVKVISFGALWKRENILSVLSEAVDKGHWLVFSSCHLLEQWDDEVVAGICQSMSSVREEQTHIHPAFQLWFITQECALCSVPAAVRMRALALVCGSPWNLKDELSSSFREVVSVMQNESAWNMTADNKELLLRCAIFHSVLLQRQRYKYLDQGRIYSWSQDDLLALMDAYLRAASHCHDRIKALKYIAVNLVHGGHVLDPAELKVMESVAETCFSTQSPLSSSGPHLLLDLIFKHGNFDLSELHQVLERNSADINDPLMLGFSHEMMAWISKINSQVLNIQLKASQTSSGAVRSLSTKLSQSTSLPAYSQVRDQLQALKSVLTHKNNSTDLNAEALSPSPLRDFLQAEWDDLIDSVSVLLSRLQQPVQYSTLTFASLLDFTDLSRLKRRAELLSAYLFHLDTSDPPGAYRLAAFKNAKGFLAAVMREAAQFNRKNISDISQQFEVLSDSTLPTTLAPDSVYLCGLELRGASWNTQLGALQDTSSSQPCSLPLVCVKAEVMGMRNTLTSKPAAQVKQTSTACGPQLPLYNCPLYLERDQESGNWELAGVHIITTVPLHAELNPLLCNLRRVRLVSML